MEIHKPKPMHSAREFAIELGTIVLGILIAIGLEQAVEAWHWRRQVGEAREAIHAEVGESNRYYTFLVQTKSCVDRRLLELQGIVEDVAAGRKVAPVGLVGLHLGNGLDNTAWESQRAAQALAHFPKAELAGLGTQYAAQSVMRGWVAQEEDAWADLRMLEGDPNRLNQYDLSVLRRAIQHARSVAYLMHFVSMEALKSAKASGLPMLAPDPSDVVRACRPLSRTSRPQDFTTT